MIMELTEIAGFAAVVAEGSFTRAAASLHVSQPAISRRIELLERELGEQLFDRVPAGARLTDAGRAFLPHARRILAEVRDGTDAVQEVMSEGHGSVNLAMVGTLASTPFPRQLQAFRSAHPLIRLGLLTARSDEVSRFVQSGEAHVGLRYFDDPRPGIESRLVREESLVVVCAGKSTQPYTKSVDANALAGIPWISYPTGSGSSGEPFARVLERRLVTCGLDTSETIIIDSLTAQKRLIEADFGLGLLPLSGIEEELRLGTLRQLSVPELEVTIPIMLIHRGPSNLSRASLSLVEALVAAPISSNASCRE